MISTKKDYYDFQYKWCFVCHVYNQENFMMYGTRKINFVLLTELQLFSSLSSTEHSTVGLLCKDKSTIPSFCIENFRLINISIVFVEFAVSSYCWENLSRGCCHGSWWTEWFLASHWTLSNLILLVLSFASLLLLSLLSFLFLGWVSEKLGICLKRQFSFKWLHYKMMFTGISETIN